MGKLEALCVNRSLLRKADKQRLLWLLTRSRRLVLRVGCSTILLLSCRLPSAAQWNPSLETKVAETVRGIVQSTGVPSAEVGVVLDDKIVYTHAFGLARLQPPLPAVETMAYPTGSISKQFTATAILLLQQDGKLKLDDPVSRFCPELTRAHEVTIRNLLTHTSGYQDYAPQDYTIPRWHHPVDSLELVHEFAGKPLDFAPGTQWQYSNTNFVLAALIVQKASGLAFADFMRTRVLAAAGLKNVLNLNTQQQELEVTGYMRNALGPLRPAAMEAPGWYFGDADLAMPVASLLAWDQTILNQSLLSPDSYREFESSFQLKNGRDSHYGLGVSVVQIKGEPALEHSGEVGGFVAENMVLPRRKIAVAVLTNQEASPAASSIARAVLAELSPAGSQASSSPAEASMTAFAPQLKTILARLAQGRIDRALLTPDAQDYFGQEAIGDFRSSLAPLGQLTAVTLERSALRGGMSFGMFRASYSGGKNLTITVYLEPDGKIEQLLVVGQE